MDKQTTQFHISGALSDLSGWTAELRQYCLFHPGVPLNFYALEHLRDIRRALDSIERICEQKEVA